MNALNNKLANLSAASLDAAVKALALFEARKARKAHPAGSFDKGHRFWLSDEETCDCCAGIRQPSRAYPHTHNAHGRSLGHCESLVGADHADVLLLKKFVKASGADADSKESIENALLSCTLKSAPEVARVRM